MTGKANSVCFENGHEPRSCPQTEPARACPISYGEGLPISTFAVS
jgi:hypothetical protein